MDRDEFASLVLQAHLQSRKVQLVRAVCHYLRQAGLGASPSYVRGILSAHPDFVRHWVEMFEQRFAPEAPASIENRRPAEAPGQMFLAIEEPELFQHPTQARAFASVRA